VCDSPVQVEDRVSSFQSEWHDTDEAAKEDAATRALAHLHKSLSRSVLVSH
jgi:hypothetical protein